MGNADGIGAIFAEITGDNVLIGASAPVVDDGAFDCDGDGTNDPNVFGPGVEVSSGSVATAESVPNASVGTAGTDRYELR
jgi:hypothetical protein